jgi:hypothetical protein
MTAGERVVISVEVSNPKRTAESYTVKLRLFGEVVNVRQVTVPPGDSKTVRFPHNIAAPGTYTARAGNESVEIRVVDGASGSADATPRTNTTQPGFGLGLTLVSLALTAATLLAARRD